MMYKDYQIWQMKKGDELHYCRFENYETAKKAKPELNLSNYELVYDDDIRVDDGLSDIQMLDLLYAKFNEGSQIPNDFKGHSLSVSDLVNIEGNYYYIQDIGYKQLDESFLDDLTLAKMYINEYCAVEYENEHPEPFRDYTDFDNLERVPLAYTTLTDEELEINTYADLKNYRIWQEFDGEIFILGKYDSLKEMNENYLKGLNLDDLIFVDFKVQDRHSKAEKQARSERLEALTKLNLSTPRYDLPFLTGSALLSHTFVFQDEGWDYIGGLDMEGHERKDNFDKRESYLSVSSGVSGYITVYTSGTGEWYDNEYQFFDPTKADNINSLKIILDRFIANSEVLSVWKSPSELVSDNEIIERKESIISDEPLDLTEQDKLNL